MDGSATVETLSTKYRKGSLKILGRLVQRGTSLINPVISFLHVLPWRHAPLLPAGLSFHLLALLFGAAGFFPYHRAFLAFCQYFYLVETGGRGALCPSSFLLACL